MATAVDYILADPFHFPTHGLTFYRQYYLFFTIIALAYLPMMWTLKWIMRDRKPVAGLRPFMIIYNWALSFFNGLCAYYTFRAVSNGFQLDSYSFDQILCTDLITNLGDEAARWMFLFTVSKPFEMIDTVLLILKKRPVILLHWWHHISVMLFCWHICFELEVGEGGEGMMFALMNAFIHLLMYGYYGLTAMGLKLGASMASVLTMLQIVQMVLGTALEVKKAFFCPKAPGTWSPYFGLVMYGSYFVLFLHYYITRYITKTKAKGE